MCYPLANGFYALFKMNKYFFPPLLDTISQINKNYFGTQRYEHWIVFTQKKCRLLQLEDKEKESNICRDLFICTEHLRVSVNFFSFHTELESFCSFWCRYVHLEADFEPAVLFRIVEYAELEETPRGH